MRLLVAIVHAEDADEIARALSERAIQSTRIEAKGGFLAMPAAVFLIGVEKERTEEVKSLIVEKSTGRTLTPAESAGEGGEILIGGAVIFVLEVLEFVKL